MIMDGAPVSGRFRIQALPPGTSTRQAERNSYSAISLAIKSGGWPWE
jgi:hypothetical protein